MSTSALLCGISSYGRLNPVSQLLTNDHDVAENIRLAEQNYGSASSGFGAYGQGRRFEVWKSLSQYIQEWFYSPDMDALRMTYSIMCAHYAATDKPAWYMLLGDSGTGKTALAIDPCQRIHRTHILSQVSKNAFISGYKGTNSSEKGLLQRGSDSKSMIWLFKDFTTVVSMNENDARTISGQLREAWDGETSKATGLGQVKWKGRITCIAAGTPAVERHWAKFREYGERFVTYRWRTPLDRIKTLTWVAYQAQFRDKIDESLKEQVFQLLHPSWLGELLKTPLDLTIPPAFFLRLANLVDLTARMTTIAQRNFQGKLVNIPAPEMGSRLINATQYMAKGHMALMGRPVAGEPEERLAKRLLMDSIPLLRRKILGHLPFQGMPSTRVALARKMGVPQGSLYDEIDELVYMNILEKTNDFEPLVSWTQEFLDIAERAGLTNNDLSLSINDPKP